VFPEQAFSNPFLHLDNSLKLFWHLGLLETFASKQFKTTFPTKTKMFEPAKTELVDLKLATPIATPSFSFFEF